MRMKMQGIPLWPDIVENTSTAGMLHTAMGHVAYNLGEMIGTEMDIADLHVETVSLSTLSSACVNPEREAVGIYLLIEGDLSGEAILMLCPETALILSDYLLEVDPGTTTELDEMACSALSELGNVTLASFLNAVADLTHIPLRVSPPSVVVDMLAVNFEAVALSAAPVSDELLIIKTRFESKEGSLQIQFWVLPDMVSFIESSGAAEPVLG